MPIYLKLRWNKKKKNLSYSERNGKSECCYSNRETPGQNGYVNEFYYLLREEIIPKLHKQLRNIGDTK